ncbi:MAG: hypothetical protein HOV79_12245 [Hamadaea sp.]|nr:hypothetical protein [Hamadaea sp.]
MPDPTLPLPTEPIEPHGRRPVEHATPVDPYADAPLPSVGYLPAYPPEPPAPPVSPAYYAPEPMSPHPVSPHPVSPQPVSPSAPPPAIAAPPVPAALPVTPAPPAPIVSRIGEISVSSTTIYTPTGELPLRGSQWVLSDQWQAHSKIPAWAIVMTILTFFCIPIFNFLFLLAKETYYTGVVAVSVSGSGRHYVARIPVANQAQVANLQSQVNYVRSLATL